MTNYGAIPTSSHASPVVDLESISQDNQYYTATRRPWRVMFDFQSTGLPRGVSDAFSRINTNLGYFRRNYQIVVFIVALIFIFVSLIKYPISLIVFTVLISLWIFYNLRDEPIKLFRYQIDVLFVRICLTLITVAFLLSTNVTYHIGWPFLIGYVLVLIHTLVRKTEDLFLDEEVATTTETC